MLSLIARPKTAVLLTILIPICDTFLFTSDDSSGQSFGVAKPIPTTQPQTIKSPRVLWELSNSHVHITYTVNETPSQFSIRYVVECRKVIRLELRTVKYWKETDISGYVKIQLEDTGVEKMTCIPLFEEDDEKLCSTFRLKVKIFLEDGDVEINIPEFKPNCELNSVQSSANCNFDESSCSFRNDACGIVSWKLGNPDYDDDSDRRRKRSYSDSYNTVSLLKSQTTTTCSNSISIVDLQPSGFSVTEGTDKRRKRAIGPNREPRSSSNYALFLDPDDIGSYVAIGVFNTPTLTYGSSNAVLSFTYYFYAEGLHQIVIGMVCMEDTSYMRLGTGYDNYDVTNFVFSTYDIKGIKCLDLHSYLGDCSSYQVQFVGGAVSSKLVVDDVAFYESIEESPCSELDNISTKVT